MDFFSRTRRKRTIFKKWDNIMDKIQNWVLEFHRKFNYLINDKPKIINYSQKKFRIFLMKEEFNELLRDIKSNIIIDIADSLGDLLYVVYGTAICYGLDMLPIIQTIHLSNMTKSISGSSTKKAIKGNNYISPNLDYIIRCLLYGKKV